MAEITFYMYKLIDHEESLGFLISLFSEMFFCAVPACHVSQEGHREIKVKYPLQEDYLPESRLVLPFSSRTCSFVTSGSKKKLDNVRLFSIFSQESTYLLPARLRRKKKILRTPAICVHSAPILVFRGPLRSSHPPYWSDLSQNPMS